MSIKRKGNLNSKLAFRAFKTSFLGKTYSYVTNATDTALIENVRTQSKFISVNVFHSPMLPRRCLSALPTRYEHVFENIVAHAI